MHPLENVIWQALTSRQTEFALAAGDARRFVPEVTSLCAFREANDRGYESLAELLRPGETGSIFLDSPYLPRRGWTVLRSYNGLQMVHERDNVSENASSNLPAQIVPLGAADSVEMLELATLTKPGPFGPRTHELGDYFGIRQERKLVAMAGERMKVPGYTEVSAVCTHPEHTGLGYAAALMSHVMRGIRNRGEACFLHVREDNTRAIDLYRRLGFRLRMQGYFVFLRRE